MPIRSKPARAPARRTSSRLHRYNEKRDLSASGEPAGRAVKAAAGPVRRFVIQKHDATRLHFDLRLEMDGVYRSWAVPKGLPTEPGERSLAVEVEDHPLEYGNFEGVIPEGNYGAGTVMLWDRGQYTVSGVTPEEGYRQGKMHMALSGQKCVGEWTLVRMPNRGDEKHTNWLVIKNNSPAHEAPMHGAAREQSVLSGRSMNEIAGNQEPSAAREATSTHGRAASAHVGRGRRTPPKARRSKPTRGAQSHTALAPATFVAPMKALSVEEVPDGQWRLEIKFDGFRAIALLNEGRVELWSRNRKPLTDHFPEIAEALRNVRCANAVIDGEIVALDAEGRSRFQLLQNRGTDRGIPIVYYVFDLLHHDGRTMLEAPLEERQMALQVLVGKRSDVVRVSPVFDVEPITLLAEAKKKQLEGIIAKTPGSVYEPDRRSGLWLKCKVHGEQEFVIGGFTPPKNSRQHFGAILVGYYEGGKLMYAGKVGSGFDTAKLASLHREFLKRRTDRCPFANLPAPRKPRYGMGMTAAAMKEVTWIKPELVAQVQFTEWTNESSLRHPVFLGLREDKRAKEVVKERV
jgi:bifunctional non-homologous end joining protein LigD